MTSSNPQYGFTLVEILITAAVAAILAGLLLPIVISARAASRTDVCLGNLRQLGQAINIYSHDYDEALPYAVDANSKATALLNPDDQDPSNRLVRALPTICEILRQYGATSEMFRCPQDTSTLPLIDPISRHRPTWFEEFGSSYHYNDRKALTGATLGAFIKPSAGYLMGDYERFHADKVNVLFADLHVKTSSWTQRCVAMDEKE